MNCRHCDSELRLTLADLGTCPPSNSYLTPEQLESPEKWYPLRVLVCESCWLAQTADFVEREECFSANYAYFSSCSTTWVDHARRYAETVISRFELGPQSQVLEIAANDGYLLQHFVQRAIPCYGVEPTESTAKAARDKGIEIVGDFFGSDLAGRLAQQKGHADLVAANNVLAHVPDINDFAAGIAQILRPGGVATFEFPHLLQLIEKNYFDTIYHEHFSYLSLHAVRSVLEAAALRIFDVEELPTHGGSLRVYASLRNGVVREPSTGVHEFLEKERQGGLLDATTYKAFPARMKKAKNDLLSFLLECATTQRRVAAYGAAAKGNTMLNYAGIRSDLLPYVVDRSPGKIGTFLPGSRIPVFEELKLREDRPDFIVILPWNLRDEIATQLDYAREWGAKFVVALPRLEIF